MFKPDKVTTDFLLISEDNDLFTDLIKFDQPIKTSEIKKTIELCKYEKPEYTNEDIYAYLENLGIDFTVTWLGNCKKIYY